jgi:hypothetical protein
VGVLAEVLRGEHLHAVIGCERQPDRVRAGRLLAPTCTLEKVQLRGGSLLQPVCALHVKQQTARIADDDQILSELVRQLQLLHDRIRDRAERVLRPALPHFGPADLKRGVPADRIETRPQRPPPRLGNRLAHLTVTGTPPLQPRLGEDALPEALKLTSAHPRIRRTVNRQPLVLHPRLLPGSPRENRATKR